MWALQNPYPLCSSTGLCDYFYAGTILFCYEYWLLMTDSCCLLWGIALGHEIHFSQKCLGGPIPTSWGKLSVNI